MECVAELPLNVKDLAMQIAHTMSATIKHYTNSIFLHTRTYIRVLIYLYCTVVTTALAKYCWQVVSDLLLQNFQRVNKKNTKKQQTKDIKKETFANL